MTREEVIKTWAEVIYDYAVTFLGETESMEDEETEEKYIKLATKLWNEVG